MLIGVDSSTCSFSPRNRSTLCSTTKCHQNKLDLENVLVQKSFFSISSILSIPIMLIGINGDYFPAICRVCFHFLEKFLISDLSLHLDWHFFFGKNRTVLEFLVNPYFSKILNEEFLVSRLLSLYRERISKNFRRQTFLMKSSAGIYDLLNLIFRSPAALIL